MRTAFRRILSFLMIAALLASLVVTLNAANSTLRKATEVVPGTKYMMSISGIKPTGSASGFDCAVVSDVVGAAGARGLGYDVRPTEESKVTDRFLWEFTRADNGGYYVRSVSTGKYLWLTASEAYLDSTPMALKVSGSGKFVICTEVNGTEYSLRFTNAGTPRWHSGSLTSSREFALYSTGTPNMEGYDNTGKKPLFTVACFSDLHVDYGIQSWATPIRKGTINAAQKLISMGGADLVLVGGDMTSTNSKDAWSNAKIAAAKQTIYDTLAPVSKTGKVLFVSGNHEFQAGYRAGKTVDSSDYTSFMTAACGEFVASDYMTIDGVKSLLGYRYCIDGMHVIGINSPYYIGNKGTATWKAYAESWLYASQIDWLGKQLKEIGKDETVIVLCHYPAGSVATRVPGTDELDSSASNPARTKLQSLLKQYPNIIYCYGHVHSSDDIYCWYGTGEVVSSSGAVSLGKNTYNTSAYINCHMGSMGYYDNQFQPGGLKAAEPQIVQAMMIRFYDDHITFQAYNCGEKSGDSAVYDLASFTVMRNMATQLHPGTVPETDPKLISYDYTISGSNVTIDRYKGAASSVQVPSEVTVKGNVYTVTSVKDSAFADTAVTSVTLPSTVTQIGKRAFYNCEKLTNVYFNAVDPQIGEEAFGGKTSAKKIGVTLHGLPGHSVEAYDGGDGVKFESMLKIGSSALALTDDLTMQFSVDRAVLTAYDSARLQVTLGEKIVDLTQWEGQGNDGVFSFAGIGPHQMGDTVSATLYVKRGENEYSSKPMENSVKKYCITLLKDSDVQRDPDLCKVIVDLLNYGAAAQKYAKYNVKSLANAQLSAAQREKGTKEAPSPVSVTNKRAATVASPAAVWTGARLDLAHTVRMQFLFTADSADGLSVRVADKAGKVLQEIPASALFRADGALCASFSGFHAGQMNDEVRVTVLRDGKPISDTLQYSVASYVAAKQKDPDADLVALVNALLNYGNSVAAYAAK